MNPAQGMVKDVKLSGVIADNTKGRGNARIDFQKLNFQNPSKIHKNRNKTRLKYTHLQSL